MKKKQWLLSLVLVLALVAGAACAVAATDAGNVPRRGIVLPMTEADVEMGIGTVPSMAATEDVAELPILYMAFTDAVGMQEGLARFSDEQLADPAMQQEVMAEAYSHTYATYCIALFEKEYYDAQMAEGAAPAQLVYAQDAMVLGENDGYVYIAFDASVGMAYPTPEAQQRVEAAKARTAQLLQGVTFQPIVFAPGEITQMPNAFPAFNTQDLDGAAVDNSIFAGKDLTVINIWGTFCTPCINEMPQLAEWSASMPDNVQLVGLVSDLNTADDAETLETARMICEMTGADNYLHLVTNADFSDLLAGVVGVPTTLFVDGSGALVGEPIVGANVPACMAAVEALLAGE